MHWNTKIMRYGLGELVSKLASEGKNYFEIARACNSELEKRLDREKYSEVTVQNVKQFLQSLARDNNMLKEYIENQKNAIEVRDTVEEIRELVTKTRTMLDKAYEEENLLAYSRMHTALLEALKVLATIEGKLKNYITVELFTEHIVKIVNIIVNDPELNARDKRRLITNIKEGVLPIIDQLLPSTDGLQQPSAEGRENSV